MSKNAIYIESRAPEKKPDRRLTVGDKFEEGGMSLLMEAIDTNLMRKVAMKILKDDKNKDEYELSRMVIEAQITSQLDHPNIVPIYDLGLDKKKRLFFTMKKIQGKPLFELINEKDLSERSEKDIFRLVRIEQQHFCHRVDERRLHGCEQRFVAQRLSTVNLPADAALDTPYFIQATMPGDVGGLGRPGGDGAHAGDTEKFAGDF